MIVLTDNRCTDVPRGRTPPEGPGGTWSGPGAEALDEHPASHLAATCRCGWMGPDRPYHPQGGRTPDGQHDGQGRTAHADWHAHATAALVAAVPEDHAARLAAMAGPLGELADERPRAALVMDCQLRALADHLEPLTVAEALHHTVPWETLGEDLGQSRQAVHGRYTRHPSQDLESRVQFLTGGSLADLLHAASERLPGTPPPAHQQWPRAVRRILDGHHYEHDQDHSQGTFD